VVINSAQWVGALLFMLFAGIRRTASLRGGGGAHSNRKAGQRCVIALLRQYRPTSYPAREQPRPNDINNVSPKQPHGEGYHRNLRLGSVAFMA
jgi:hypothetical protein